MAYREVMPSMWNATQPTMGQVGQYNIPTEIDPRTAVHHSVAKGCTQLNEPYYSAFMEMKDLGSMHGELGFQGRWGKVTLNYKGVEVERRPKVGTHRWFGGSYEGEPANRRMLMGTTVYGKIPMKNASKNYVGVFQKIYVHVPASEQLYAGEVTSKNTITPNVEVGIVATEYTKPDVVKDDTYFHIGWSMRGAVPGQPLDLLIRKPQQLFLQRLAIERNKKKVYAPVDQPAAAPTGFLAGSGPAELKPVEYAEVWNNTVDALI